MASVSLDTALQPLPPAPLVDDLSTVVEARLPSLAGITRPGLAKALADIGVPEREVRMRAGQIWHWIYHRGVTSFEEMTNVGKALRAELIRHFSLDRPQVVSEQVSKDGTRKWLLRMPSTGKHDRGAEIEA